MKQIVFYSWQSDLPNATNRGFIQAALENAASVIASDESVEIEPVVDRDTQGVPGSPDIAQTIFAKIGEAHAFVADVSIISQNEKRPTPNPNVLLELGYALKAVGQEKVILVLNRAFGKVENLPFDLRTRRVLSYDMPLDADGRSPVRKDLERQLEIALRAALTDGNRKEESESIPSVTAIETHATNRLLTLRRDLAGIFKRIDQMQPRTFSGGCTVDEFITQLKETEDVVEDFARICEIVALMSDIEAAVEITRWFGNIFERYHLAKGFAGSYKTSDFDYFKFLGHEMFVTFVAFALKEQRWSILARILDEPIPMRHLSRRNGPGFVTWEFGSEHLPSLLDESRRRRRVSLHSDILRDRHSTGKPGSVLSIQEFTAADVLLYLLGEIRQADHSGLSFTWRPWSALYLEATPLFLLGAERKKTAEEMLTLFQVKNVEEMRQRILECSRNLGKLFGEEYWLASIEPETILKIGSK